jgi:hypothetical protein
MTELRAGEPSRQGSIMPPPEGSSNMSSNRFRWIGRTALTAAAAAAAYRWIVRPRHERWGASDEEIGAPLPGDDLIAEPAAQVTRAIAIAAPPEQVWPWVVQLGADRGGFYSYDRLENLFGLGIHSADVIVEDWQDRAVGDLMAAHANGSFGWYVMAIEPSRAMVVKMADVEAGRPTRRDEPPFMEFTWSFVLRPQGDGSTRLLVRERIAFGKASVRMVSAPVGLVSFMMTQKMMRGIKERAEQHPRAASVPTPPAPSSGGR